MIEGSEDCVKVSLGRIMVIKRHVVRHPNFTWRSTFRKSTPISDQPTALTSILESYNIVSSTA